MGRRMSELGTPNFERMTQGWRCTEAVMRKL
jgi:hypothetical protein